MAEKKSENAPDENDRPPVIGANRIHAESIGDVWVALTGQMPQNIMGDVVGTVLQAGGTRPAWQWSRGGQEYVLMAWPEDQPIRAAVLLGGKPGEKLKPLTVVPLLEGIPNNLQIEEIHPRREGAGADVGVEMLADKNPMWFFDPLYARDKDDLTPGVTHTFWLAGVALSLRKALLDNITLTNGPFYEKYAEKWLLENPDKKSGDVPPLRIDIKDKHIIMPGHHFGEYQMRGVIIETEDWLFEKMPVKAIYLKFPFEGREPLQLVVYASKFILGEYEPKTGDEIDSYIWLEGRIIDLPQEGVQAKSGENNS